MLAAGATRKVKEKNVMPRGDRATRTGQARPAVFPRTNDLPVGHMPHRVGHMTELVALYASQLPDPDGTSA